MAANTKLTEAEIAFIITLKESTDLTWPEISQKFNKKFSAATNANSVANNYQRYKDLFKQPDFYVKNLREIHSTRKSKSLMSREYKAVMDSLDQQSSIMEGIDQAIESVIKKLKIKPKKIVEKKTSSKGKKPMTKEVLLSDIHFGKKTDSFDLAICKNRLQEVTRVLLEEIKRDSAHYNVEKIIVALLGDIIESATMHNLESAKGCEFGNSRQVYEAIEGIFDLVIKPLAQTQLKIVVKAVTGNHDRTEHDRTYNDPGVENVTYTIYKALEKLSKVAGYTNVSYDIPKEPWAIEDIYGKTALYEHGDNSKGMERKALENLMTTRAKQLKKPIEWLRVGHFHCKTVYGLFNIMINGSLPGDDSYSLVKGYASEACQVINSYVKTDNRPSPFYKSLAVQLDHIK